MTKFESKDDLVKWVEIMHLQNTNGRESNDQMFRLGIEAAIDELIELNLFSLTAVIWQSEQCCEPLNKSTFFLGTTCPECNKPFRNVKSE